MRYLESWLENVEWTLGKMLAYAITISIFSIVMHSFIAYGMWFISLKVLQWDDLFLKIVFCWMVFTCASWILVTAIKLVLVWMKFHNMVLRMREREYALRVLNVEPTPWWNWS